MPIDVVMPKLGESITEGTILEWKKQVGDSIKKDETLLEISTDKVDSEVPSPASGTIIEVLFKVNDVVPVGEVIARVGDSSDKPVAPKVEKPKQEVVTEPVKEEVIKPKKEKTSKIEQTEAKTVTLGSSNKFYSPLVKSIAKKENISLSELDSLSGSGLNGRVNKEDLMNYIKSRGEGSVDSSADTIAFTSKEYALEDKVEPMGHVRKMIATHMKKSRDTSVHVYSTSEVDMTGVVQFRNSNKGSFNEKYQTPLTYTPFIIDAVIKAVHEFPLMNACLDGENIKHNQNISVGVAVALPDDNLIVPVIKRAEELNFLGLARSTNDLAVRARNGKLNPDEAQGSTFTVTNPGIFGSLFGMGIINQPNVGLLSVGAIHKRPVVKETEYGDVVVPRSMMYLTLAYDHRIIDGAYGTRFLSRIKDLLESFDLEAIKL